MEYHMTQISINEWLSTTTPKTPSQETSMTTYSFQPLTKAHRTADYYLDTWIATMQADGNIDTLWGRIIRTNINYIAIGYNGNGEWTKIPCANLNTAKLYIGRFMTERLYKRHAFRQKEFARIEAERINRALQGKIDKPTVCLAKADK